jgi:branched-subunit amino acid aminotransferase/4-amino-4-deoxychorismate lyase
VSAAIHPAPPGSSASHPADATPAVALKETCRATRGAVPLWPWHRARLAAGGCGEALLAQADVAVAQAAADWATAPTRRARLTLVVAPDGSLSVAIAQRLSSLDVPSGPVVARVDLRELPLPAVTPPLPDPPAKPADRSWWDAAHRAAKARGAHQAVLVDDAGDVVDGSTAAVWIAEDDVLVTPLSPPAIPSVSVAFVCARAAESGLAVRVEPISWERFGAADEAFLTNAFGGAVPVRGRGGALFERVAELFSGVWA